MRKDFLINVESKDLKLVNNFSPNATFRLTSTGEQLEGQVILEDDYRWETYVQNGSLKVIIPYLPYERPLHISVLKTGEATPASSSLEVKMPGGSTLPACLFSAINQCNFILIKQDDYWELYSGDDFDFQIGNANHQNKAALLSCLPGSNYRYPTVGVGLSKWIGAPSNLPGLAQKLMEEFESDGTPVISARYSDSNKTLYLNLDTVNVDMHENL